MTEHCYATSLTWAGSTGAGYDAYDRSHQLDIDDKASVALTADSPFSGNGRDPNPEELLLAAASSCQLLSFLAVAARARIDVVGYSDDATAVMPEGSSPMWISEIDLHPVIDVAPGTRLERLPRLVEVAHRECFIAASLRTRMTIHATVRVGGSEVAGFTVGDTATHGG